MFERHVTLVLFLSAIACSESDGGNAGPGSIQPGSGGSGGTAGSGGKAPGTGGAKDPGLPDPNGTTRSWGKDGCEAAARTLPSGTKRYVDPNGDDSNPGTEDAPWKTLAKANASLVAGESVIVRGGTYAEVIRPESSGTSPTERITYLAAPGETVSVTGAADGGSVVELSGRDYVTVEGFALRPAEPRTDGEIFADVTIRGNGNEIRGCSIVAPVSAVESYQNGTNEIAIGVYSGENNVVEQNRVENVWYAVIIFNPSLRTTMRCNSFESTYMDTIHFESRKGLIAGDIVEHNDLGSSYVSDGIQFNGDFDLPPDELAADTSSCGVVIRKNKIFGNAENAVDLKGTCRIVVEDNLIYGNVGDNDGTTEIAESCSTTVNDRCGGSAIMHGSGTSARDNVIRRNVVYDNSGGIGVFDSWRVYNNTIVANNRDWTGSSSSYAPTDKPLFVGLYGYGIIKNNLVGNHLHAETAVSVDAEAIDGNLYFNTLAPGGPFFAFGVDPWQAKTFAEWLSELPSDGKEGASLVATPSFAAVPDQPTADLSELDFTLAAGSAAIDRGVALTYAPDGGSGNQIVVADAGYFFDGFGVTSGDRIIVGSNGAVRIVSIDYDANVLTLESDISWQSSDGVFLEYAGAAPDIGALERP